MDIDKLRQKYINMPPYQYDTTIKEGRFSEEEITIIKEYGNWFDAIWEDKVPLVTDKLKHFRAAKDVGFKKRTKYEDLWFRYKSTECPFY